VRETDSWTTHRDLSIPAIKNPAQIFFGSDSTSGVSYWLIHEFVLVSEDSFLGAGNRFLNNSSRSIVARNESVEPDEFLNNLSLTLRLNENSHLIDNYLYLA
jgi:hypothetical protein